MNLSQREEERLNNKRGEATFVAELKEMIKNLWETEEGLGEALNLIEKFFNSKSLELNIEKYQEEIEANMERIKGILESWRRQ